MQGAPDTMGRVQKAALPAKFCRQSSDLRVLLIPADASGFVAIGEDLTVQGSRGNVFCVGDMATCAIHPRPKAGVYAVRQGPPLTNNIRRSPPPPPLSCAQLNTQSSMAGTIQSKHETDISFGAHFVLIAIQSVQLLPSICLRCLRKQAACNDALPGHRLSIPLSHSKTQLLPLLQSNTMSRQFLWSRVLSGRDPKPFKPQSTHLSLITTGGLYAVATNGPFCLEVGACPGDHFSSPKPLSLPCLVTPCLRICADASEVELQARLWPCLQRRLKVVRSKTLRALRAQG